MPSVQRFDVRAPDARLRRATAALDYALLAGVAGFYVGGGVIVTIAVWASAGTLVLLGAGTIALGGLISVLAYRARRVRVVTVTVDERGIVLGLISGGEARAEWDDPQLRLILADHAAARARSQRRWKEVPAQLLCMQYHIGLPQAAYDAIRGAATRHRVPITEITDDDGVRACQVGSGPETGRPFRPV